MRLYKAISKKYAHRLLDVGEMMWSTLTWFQNDEDSDRRDEHEGSRRYFPVNGLDVNRLLRDGRPHHAAFNLPDHGIVSRAAQSNHIFIYSTTVSPMLEIGDPTDRVFVEIFDPPRFAQRIRQTVTRHARARLETTIYNEVQYWEEEDPPREVWALPDRLTMLKHSAFRHQREYRFAVGTRANVFDFENVELFVVDKDTRWPRLQLESQRHRMKLYIGAATDCCRIF